MFKTCCNKAVGISGQELGIWNSETAGRNDDGLLSLLYLSYGTHEQSSKFGGFNDHISASILEEEQGSATSRFSCHATSQWLWFRRYRC